MHRITPTSESKKRLLSSPPLTSKGAAANSRSSVYNLDLSQAALAAEPRCSFASAIISPKLKDGGFRQSQKS